MADPVEVPEMRRRWSWAYVVAAVLAAGIPLAMIAFGLIAGDPG